MADLSLTCPHCETQNTGFTLICATSYPSGEQLGNVFMTCNLCNDGIVVKVEYYLPAGPEYLVNNKDQRHLLRNENYFKIIEIYPKLKPTDVPDYLPERVANSFLQAKKSLASQLWDSAGAMCRKALERSLTHIHPEMKGKKLVTRISDAAQAGLITPALEDWAHRVRIDGNEATHEDDFTKEEAKDLVNFTEMVLTYLFTLPGLVKKKKTANEQITANS